MNGALNNASMALEIALSETARVDDTSDSTLRRGLAAIAQASRAAALIAYLAQGRSAPNDPEGAYANDVGEILREHARSIGATLPSAPAADAGGGAAQAAEALVAGLARLTSKRG